MQPERLAGRESGVQRGASGFLFPLGTVDTLRLRKAECELRLAAQSLWDYRTKDTRHVAVCNLLEGSQDELALLIQHLHEVRTWLDEREEL